MNRRTFLQISALSALSTGWFSGLSGANSKKSKLVYIKHGRLNDAFNPSLLKEMLGRSLKSLTDAANSSDAWSNFLSTNDTVGIKINCLAGRGLSTRPELVQAIAESLHDFGIPEERIIVWDRNNRDLVLGGYKIGIRNGLYRCYGTDEVGFDDRLYEKSSVGSLISSILTKRCTAIINVPVLKDHGITGISLSMKNYYGAIHNPNKYHPNGGSPYIADLNSLDVIRQKERLIICDCLKAQYNGGPAYAPTWNWTEGALLIGCDPVALDYTGMKIIEKKRRENGLPSLKEEKRYPAYIFEAEKKYGLGYASDEKIDIIRESI